MITPKELGPLIILKSIVIKIFSLSKTVELYLNIVEPPEAPVNLSIVETKSRSVLLSWFKPFDGHSPLISYIIEYQNITGMYMNRYSIILNVYIYEVKI